MSLSCLEPAALLPVTLADVRAYLRVDAVEDEPLLAALTRTATALCEQFTGRVLLHSVWRQRAHGTSLMTLMRMPLTQIIAARTITPALIETTIDVNTLIVTGHPDDVITLTFPAIASDAPIEVDYRAGLASDPNHLPEPLRHGLLRLCAHLYEHRDAPDASGVPAAVTALWRPYRCTRLG